jgi:hypothetical protein
MGGIGSHVDEYEGAVEQTHDCKVRREGGKGFLSGCSALHSEHIRQDETV